MKRHALFFLLPVFVLLTACHPRKKISVTHLTCEHVVNPVGIDILNPRLSWQLLSAENGGTQTAYHILAATTKEKLNDAQADLWNTGKVISSRSSLVRYRGKALKPRMRVWWKVRVWDRDDRASGWSRPAGWETGIGKKDWQATWIGNPGQPDAKPGGPNPAFYFRKDISLPATPGKARVYISGLGYYELYINGKKAGNHVLSPNHSNYSYRDPARFDNPLIDNMSCRVYYETYDITTLLKKGDNTLGVILGNGWFFQHERLEDTAYTYGRPRLIARFEFESPGGKKETVASDTTWKTSVGPIIHNGIYTGEIYDARLEQPGWNRTGFNDKEWVPAVIMKAPDGQLMGQIAPPDRKVREVRPVSCTRLNDTLYRYDLGEMISGWARLKVKGAAGSQIILKFIEEMGPQYGQTDTYILKGQGTETWEPRFTWHGFRYVEAVSSLPLDTSSLTGIVINTDVPQTGLFTCSNMLFNRINENFIRTQQGNMHGGVPSDCPHRERRGYTGDGQIAAPAAICNFDMSAFYTKWIGDMADGQNKRTGYVPNTVPYQSGGGGTPWGSAFIIVPWYMYLYYGDTTIIRTHWESMKKYIGYLENRLIPPGIIQEDYLGEWVPPQATAIPANLVSTAYFYHDLRLMKFLAGVLGKDEDARHFARVMKKVKKGFNRKYFHKGEMSYSIGRQGANAFALGYGLVPEKYAGNVFRTLTNHIVHDTEGHFDTGMMGTPLLLQVLSEFGRPDLAYTLMNQKDFPSFGLEILKGATTLWETWDGTASHSHPMFGSVCQWFYNRVAGINPDPAQPGFRHIIIRPRPVSDLQNARARYLSPYGPILSSWTLQDGRFTLEVSIPPNTTATVQIPAGTSGKTKASSRSGKGQQDIVFTGIKDHLATWQIPPGQYLFTAENAGSLIPESMLTAPVITPADTLLFSGDSLQVTIVTDHKNATIRYTLDGKEPDAASAVYTGPLSIRENTTLKARVFKKGQKPGVISRKHFFFVDRKKNGIRYAYFQNLWHKVPDFGKFTPAVTGRIYEISLDKIPYNKDHFGLLITTDIAIPETGEYVFYLTSNDGSKLYIDGRLVVDNDGGHGALEKSGSISLKAGRHPLRIGYFQVGGGYALSLAWKGPGFEKQMVPPCAFFYPGKKQ